MHPKKNFKTQLKHVIILSSYERQAEKDLSILKVKQILKSRIFCKVLIYIVPIFRTKTWKHMCVDFNLVPCDFLKHYIVEDLVIKWHSQHNKWLLFHNMLLIKCFVVSDNPAEDWEQSVCKRLSWEWWHGTAPDVQNAKVAIEKVSFWSTCTYLYVIHNLFLSLILGSDKWKHWRKLNDVKWVDTCCRDYWHPGHAVT